LTGTQIENDFCLISLDVVSLFTNVPTDLENILKRWSSISDNCDIPKDEFLGAVRLILDSTFFIFDNQIYKQNFGTPMGSLLSLVIADIVMQDLENAVLETIQFPISFYYRYVDDIVMAIPSSATNIILNNFNSFHPKLQFTMEKGGNNINFLDTTIILNI